MAIVDGSWDYVCLTRFDVLNNCIMAVKVVSHLLWHYVRRKKRALLLAVLYTSKELVKGLQGKI